MLATITNSQISAGYGCKTMRDSVQNEKQCGSFCVSSASFHKWMKACKDGCESITDNSRSGRPVDVFAPESEQAVEDMIRSDRRVTFNEIATKLGASHRTVYSILHEKLHFFKSQLASGFQDING